jgi:hypothetical protein
VQRKGEIRCNPLKPGIGDHRPRALAGFFGRLEQQHHTARLGAFVVQIHRQPGDHRHMPVMAAKMPAPRALRTIGQIGKLFDRQPVQLTSDQHGGSGRAALEHRGNTVPAQPGDQLIGGKRRKETTHEGSGFPFLARDFRDLVQVMAQLRQHVLRHTLPSFF